MVSRKQYQLRVRMVSDPPVWAPPLIIFGGLVLCLLRGPARAAGLAPLALGLGLWIGGAPRPTLLIAPGGAAIGVLGPDGRAVDRARGAGYAVSSWLAADGDGGDQAAAARRPGLQRYQKRVEGDLGPVWKLVRFHGLVDAERMTTHCRANVLMIAPGARQAPDGKCVWLGPAQLTALGAVAVEPVGDRLVYRSALQESAGRIWTQPPAPVQWSPDADAALAVAAGRGAD